MSLPGLLTTLHLVLFCRYPLETEGSEWGLRRDWTTGWHDTLVTCLSLRVVLVLWQKFVYADWCSCVLDNLPLPLQIHSLYFSTLLFPERLPCVEDSIELLSSFISIWAVGNNVFFWLPSCKVSVGWLHSSVKITVFVGQPSLCAISGNCSLPCSFRSTLSLSFIVFLYSYTKPFPLLYTCSLISQFECATCFLPESKLLQTICALYCLPQNLNNSKFGTISGPRGFRWGIMGSVPSL